MKLLKQKSELLNNQLQNGEGTNLQTNAEVTSDTEQPTEYRTGHGTKVIRTQRWIENKYQ